MRRRRHSRQRRSGSAGARLTTITADQAISGASNVLIAVLAARLLSASEFGLFGIVFLVYVMLVSVTRALVSDILLMYPVESEDRPGEAIGTGLMMAVALAVGLAAVGVAIRLSNPGFGDAMVVLAVCLPLLVAQDLGRYLAFATQRPIRAVVLDSVWFVVMLGAVAALFATHTHRLPWLIAAWGGSGAVAGLLLFVRYPLAGVRFDLMWLRQTWGVAWRFLVSYTTAQSGALGGSSEVGAIAGSRSLGGMQGAMLLTRPFTTFQVAVVAHGIGEVARSAGNGRRVRRHATVTSGLAIVIAAVNGVVMVVLPAGIGRVLLGASWGPAKPLLLAAAVQLVCLALATGPQAGLLGLREMGKAMGIGVLTAIALFGGAGIGALLDGAKGALWLIAAGQGLVAIVSWIVFTASTRQIEAPSAAVAAVVGREPALTSQAPVTTQQTPLAPPPAAPPVIVAPPELAAPPVVVPASLGELLRDPRLHLRRGVAAWRAQQLERRASWRRIDGYLASIEAELSAIQRPEPAQAVGRAPHAAPPPPDPMEERLARWLPPGPPSATAGPR